MPNRQKDRDGYALMGMSGGQTNYADTAEVEAWQLTAAWKRLRPVIMRLTAADEPVSYVPGTLDDVADFFRASAETGEQEYRLDVLVPADGDKGPLVVVPVEVKSSGWESGRNHVELTYRFPDGTLGHTSYVIRES